MSQSRLASNRANAQPLCWPAHRGRQETIVFERLPPRPHRPNRHPHPGRPSRLPKALRRHPRRSKSRRRPGNHPRPVHRPGLLGLNRARALENSIFTLGLQDHSDLAAGNPEVDAAFAQGRTWIEQARNLQLLTTYEQRIRRSIEKNAAELRTLQTARKAPSSKRKRKPASSSSSPNTKTGTAATMIPPTTSRPNPDRLASFFRSPPSSAASSSVNASNRPKSPTGAATVNLTTRNPMTHPPPNNALSAA